jgi:hypothetical protein
VPSSVKYGGLSFTNKKVTPCCILILSLNLKIQIVHISFFYNLQQECFLNKFITCNRIFAFIKKKI